MANDTTYTKLFEHFLSRMIEAMVAASCRSEDSVRESLFKEFLRQHLFICAACGNEFDTSDTEEGDHVLCEHCRR